MRLLKLLVHYKKAQTLIDIYILLERYGNASS